MVSKTFLHAKYATDNSDLATHYGATDEYLLRAHYENYGRRELRGIELSEYLRIEGVLCSDSGHMLISGWMDRRHVQSFDLTVDVGYERFAFGQVEPAWYRRPDVVAVTGDSDRPSGFLIVVYMEEVTPHPRVTIQLNGKTVHVAGNMRWQSVQRFMNQALGATAAIADLPFGHGMAAAEALLGPFEGVWRTFLDKLDFVKGFENGQDTPVEVSIVITIYKRADMLIPQLEALVPLLFGSGVEIVVVCNELIGAEALIERLRGFCGLWDFPLRLYLCSGNSGFSHANNFGAGVARGKTLVFMNPDVFPPEGQQHAMGVLNFLLDDPGNALHGALLYYGDGGLMHAGMYAVRDTVIDSAGATSAIGARVEHFGKGLMHQVQDGDASLEAALRGLRYDVMLVTAALWKIDAGLFHSMGGLSTDYIIAYYEDADFCLRLLERGVPIQLDQSSRWIHLEGAGKAFSPPQRSFMWLNRYLFSQRFGRSPFLVSSDDDMRLL